MLGHTNSKKAVKNLTWPVSPFLSALPPVHLAFFFFFDGSISGVQLQPKRPRCSLSGWCSDQQIASWPLPKLGTLDRPPDPCRLGHGKNPQKELQWWQPHSPFSEQLHAEDFERFYRKLQLSTSGLPILFSRISPEGVTPGFSISFGCLARGFFLVSDGASKFEVANPQLVWHMELDWG